MEIRSLETVGKRVNTVNIRMITWNLFEIALKYHFIIQETIKLATDLVSDCRSLMTAPLYLSVGASSS